MRIRERLRTRETDLTVSVRFIPISEQQVRQRIRPRGLPVSGRLVLWVLVASLIWGIACGKPGVSAAPEDSPPPAPEAVEYLKPEVRAVYPHDPSAFTQGLLWHAGHLYESSGGYGNSNLRQVVPETGRVLRSVLLPAEVFGEGLARVGDRLFVLTWREQRTLIYSLDELAPAGEMLVAGEGWGLCFDGESLVMSNGGADLTFRNPENFAIERRVRVTLNDRPQDLLNELECVGEHVYANIWGRDLIVRIVSATGRVDGLIDGSQLLPRDVRAQVDVLNGIAFNPETRTFYLTGKYWPSLYEVEFVSRRTRSRE